MSINNDRIDNFGTIISMFSGIAKISGLKEVSINEVLLDKNNNGVAVVVGFFGDVTEALFFEDNFDINEKVFASGKLFSINISESIIGRVLDGFGNQKDGFGDVKGESYTVFNKAPKVSDRKPVTRPLITGVKIIDTSLSIGKGQRELIVGDSKLGKSTLAETIVLNQKNIDNPIYCVYVLIAQKKQKIRELISLFEKNNTFLYTTIIAVPSDGSFAQIHLAPFVGTAIGEYFRDRGKDVVIVYDDLTKHAKNYRNISLLLGRIPGREAYPADVFSLHAKLLERSAQLSDEKGGGSLTSLPIVETYEGDISSFIPTNIISITDGQIFFENALFQKGFLPAINIGLSVSRIGSTVQPKTLKGVVGSIRLVLAQHKELQKLAKLETKIGKDTLDKIHRGNLILELLKQYKHTKIDWTEQVVLFYVVEKGYFDDIDNKSWSLFEKLFLEVIRNIHFYILDDIASGTFDDNTKLKIKKVVDEFKIEFLEKNNESIH